MRNHIGIKAQAHRLFRVTRFRSSARNGNAAYVQGRGAEPFIGQFRNFFIVLGPSTYASTFFRSHRIRPDFLTVARFFPLIGFPHRNNVPIISARRPHQNNHSRSQAANNADFTEIAPVIFLVVSGPGKYPCGVLEVEPACAQRPFAFREI